MATSKDVLDMLRRHYLPEGRPAGGLFADEIGSPDGRRRADLLWVPTSRTGSHSDNLIGHEIKVTRADLLSELADPTKADPWAQFCTRWWLVVPDPALIVGVDIPEMWGVYGPPSGRRTRSMTVLKPAPKLTPVDLAPALTRIMAFVVNRVEVKTAELQRDLAWKERELERANKLVEDARLAGEFGRAMSPHAKRLNTILGEVRTRSREVGWWVDDPTDDEVIDALVDVVAARAAARLARQETERLISALTDPLKTAREVLANAHAYADRGERATVTAPLGECVQRR